MRRVLLRCGKLTLYSYPTMLYLGILCGIVAQHAAARMIHLDAVRAIHATLILLVPALLGARLLFVVPNWSFYRREPRRIWRNWEGGAAMYGGLLLAVPLSIPLLAIMRIPFGSFWDTASFTMLVGMVFARVGCFLNGCCAGRYASGWLGVNLPDDRGVWQRRYPTQVLEAAWGLLVFAGAVTLCRDRPFAGAVFLFTFGAYGAGRIVLETMRQQQTAVAGLTLHRALSTAFLTISVVAFAIMWSRVPGG